MSVSERIQAELSHLGIEVGSAGDSSLLLHTPGLLYDIGGIVDRIMHIAPLAVVDVQRSDNNIELVVSWPTGQAIPAIGWSWRVAMGAALGVLGGGATMALMPAYYNVSR
jgi:hypothetical protein